MPILVGLHMLVTCQFVDTFLLPYFKNLKSLDLSDNKFGIDGIQKLSTILPGSQITALNLWNNTIGMRELER
ncbi:MAG: hypothetical protein ACRCYP_01300 [Alphaproteobacteria bacterium]